MIFRVLTTFITLIYLTFGCEAEENTYFDFSFDKDTLSSENVVEVSLDYKFPETVKEKRFKIKPFVERGLVKTLIGSEWAGVNSLWTETSSLSKNFKLKINGSFYKTDLWFEILDLKTGKIYITPKHPILNRDWFEKYIKSLNKIIFDFSRDATMVE